MWSGLYKIVIPPITLPIESKPKNNPISKCDRPNYSCNLKANIGSNPQYEK